MNKRDKVVALKHYKRTRKIMRGEEERSAPANRRVERVALDAANEAMRPQTPWWPLRVVESSTTERVSCQEATRPVAPWWRRAWWKLTGRA